MVPFLTATLVCSCAAMAALLYIKHWELTTGKMLFGKIRPQLSLLCHRALTKIEDHLPALVKARLHQGFSYAKAALHLAIARGVLSVERGLERALHLVRTTTTPPAPGTQASAFLREVAEYKKHLTRRHSHLIEY